MHLDTSTSMPLLTDLYQLTMAQAYYLKGQHNKQAIFHHFFRRSPHQGGFAICSGLGPFLDFLQNFKFSTQHLDYLATLKTAEKSPLFTDNFLNYLDTLKLSIDLFALPEGTLCFPFEPLVRVQGPLLQCQLLETPLLNFLNFSTLITTKAARLRLAAGSDPILEFGLRRAQGPDGALTATRAAYIGGIDATSNLQAGYLYGIPVAGTQAHSFILSYPTETQAFRDYASVFPDHCILLVDTYHTLLGVDHAIAIGHELQKNGKKLLGIRLDSGDLAELSQKARKKLDAAGFSTTKIYASNELDEWILSDLKHQGACIDCWAVGTSLVTGKNCSALDGVYKLSSLQTDAGNWEYKIKLSEQFKKINNPGRMQVKRFYEGETPIADLIYDLDLGIQRPFSFYDPIDPSKRKTLPNTAEGNDLLQHYIHNGEHIKPQETLTQLRQRASRSLAHFPKGVKRFLHPDQYLVGYEASYHKKKMALVTTLRENT